MSCYCTTHIELLRATANQKRDLNSAVLSAIWKETHTCSILKWVDKWHTSNLAVLVRFT